MIELGMHGKELTMPLYIDSELRGLSQRLILLKIDMPILKHSFQHDFLADADMLQDY